MNVGTINVRGLAKRGNVYYIRRRVPSYLAKLVGQDVIVRSLKTKGWVHALNALAKCEEALERLFELTKEAAKLDVVTAKRIFHGLLRQWMGSEEFGELPSPPADISMIEERLKDENNDFRDLGSDFIMQHEELGKLTSYSNIPAVEQIGHLLLRTLMEHAKQMQAIQSGKWNGKAFDPYYADAVGSLQGIAPEGLASNHDDIQPKSSKTSSGGKQVEQDTAPDAARPPQSSNSDILTYSLEHIYAAFRKENERLWDEKRWYKFDAAYRILSHVFGQHHPAKKINKLEVQHVINVLVEYPSNANKKPQLIGKSIDKQIETAKKQKLELISYKTVNTHLSHMSQIFKWAEHREFVESNPFEGRKLKTESSDKSKYNSYNQQQLQTLFSSPTYSDMKSERKWMEQGDLVVRNMRYWVPLISIHTGMRQAEICQLNVEDVREVEGILCFCLEANEGQSLKAPASKREVPIHKQLLNDWGFKDWLLKRKSKPSTKDTDKLFVEVQDKKPGKYADAFSKWFRSYRLSLGIDHPKLVFHSFRHTFVGLQRNQDIDEAATAAIVGHEHYTQTSKYGNVHKIQTKNKVMEKMLIPIQPPKLGKCIEIRG